MTPRSGRRVLVVDDNPIDRQIVIKILHKLGFKDVQEAENGTIAEAKLRNAADIDTPFDLVLLDWNMPSMNGSKLLQYVRANPKLKKIKIIVMTAASAKKTVEEAIRNGADEFVVKPVEHATVQPKIEKMFP